jgi:hypothetical protein
VLASRARFVPGPCPFSREPVVQCVSQCPDNVLVNVRHEFPCLVGACRCSEQLRTVRVIGNDPVLIGARNVPVLFSAYVRAGMQETRRRKLTRQVELIRVDLKPFDTLAVRVRNNYSNFVLQQLRDVIASMKCHYRRVSGRYRNRLLQLRVQHQIGETLVAVEVQATLVQRNHLT